MTNKEELPLCECGCNLRVTRVGNRFLKGHNNRGVPHTSAAQIAADKLQSERRRSVPQSLEHKAAISASKLGVSNSLEHNAAISAAKLGTPNPHISPAQIVADEAERGGHDIVGHHYLYDHADKSKHTIGITRSDHMKLHMLLKKLGYIVPHINIKEI